MGWNDLDKGERWLYLVYIIRIVIFLIVRIFGIFIVNFIFLNEKDLIFGKEIIVKYKLIKIKIKIKDDF